LERVFFRGCKNNCRRQALPDSVEAQSPWLAGIHTLSSVDAGVGLVSTIDLKIGSIGSIGSKVGLNLTKRFSKNPLTEE
jgi:hypothetical protein